MSKTSIIKNLRLQVAEIKKSSDVMDEASWGYEQGVLISGDEAKEIIKLLGVKNGRL